MNKSCYNNRAPLFATRTNGAPTVLVWQDQYRIPLQLQRPIIPDSNLNDRREFGPFRGEFNPYIWDEMKPRNMY